LSRAPTSTSSPCRRRPAAGSTRWRASGSSTPSRTWARLGQPEIALGLLPGYAGTQRLPRLVGKGAALEMMLTGAPIAASEALRIGLVNRVVPAGELMSAARTLAGHLATCPPIAMRYIINAVNQGMEMPFADACQYEATLFGLIASTEDMREGTAAFLEKRKPEFKGR
jgi:enoyl-CoA hydratase